MFLARSKLIQNLVSSHEEQTPESNKNTNWHTWDKLASQPEFKILVHLIKTIIDKELNIPNDLVEKIEGLKEDLDLDKGFQKTLH